MKRVLMLVPASSSVGLKTAAYGIANFLAKNGLITAVFRPIFQKTCNDCKSKHSISLEQAAKLYAKGQNDILLEKITHNFHAFSKKQDIIVIQGLLIEQNNQYTQQLNKKVANALSAELIIIGAPGDITFKQMYANINNTARFFSNRGKHNIVACIINKISPPQTMFPQQHKPFITHTDVSNNAKHIKLKNKIPLIAKIPWNTEMLRPRVVDIIPALDASIINQGNIDTARIAKITMCARSIDNIMSALQPGNLIVTAADRSDIMLAVAMAVANGLKIAGLLLTGGMEPSKDVLELIGDTIKSKLPILLTDYDSFTTTQILQNMKMHIKDNDLEQQKIAGDYIASFISKKWLKIWLAEEYKTQLTPAAFCHQLSLKAKADLKRIVLPEGSDPRIIEAAILCCKRKLAKPVLLGEKSNIETIAANLGHSLPAEIIIYNPEEIRDKYISPLVKLRSHKGVDKNIATVQLKDNIVLATMMLKQGDVDGMVAGAVNTTANTIRPALQLIKTAPGNSIVSSIFFMCLPNQVMVYGDCAINPDPNIEDLAQIAIASARSARHFGIEPIVAMLSYATGTSGKGANVEKVIAATELVKQQKLDFAIDGPLQYDAAINIDVAAKKAPDSPVAGQATVCIFPDLNTGNTTYKAVQRSADVMCIGPMLQGLNKPVNDLSRGANVDDIIFTIVITAIQAQN